MGDVPLKMPRLFSQAVEEDIRITIPDYLSILQETEVSIPTHFHDWYDGLTGAIIQIPLRLGNSNDILMAEGRAL